MGRRKTNKNIDYNEALNIIKKNIRKIQNYIEQYNRIKNIHVRIVLEKDIRILKEENKTLNELLNGRNKK